MPITSILPTTLNFPHRGVLNRDDFVNAQEASQDILAGSWTTNANLFATQANALEANVNAKEENAVAAAQMAQVSANEVGTWSVASPFVVSTIEDLTTIDTDTYKTAFVKDLDRGGSFIWSDAGTANGGTVFAGASGYWNRQYSGAINVKWFGAIAYQTNEEALSGISSSTSINNAILFLKSGSLSGGTIYFPSGIYGIGSTITLDSLSYGIKFVGDNMSVKSVLRAQSDITVFDITSGNFGSEFENIDIAGYSNGVNNIININGGFLIHFRNCFFEKADLAYAASLNSVADVSFLDCNFESGNGVNVIGTSTGVKINNCVFLNKYQYCIRQTSSNPMTVTSCSFRTSAVSMQQIYIGGASSYAIISSCVFDQQSGTTATSIRFENGGGSKVSACTFSNGNRGIYITLGANNIVVTDCHFVSMSDFGAGLSVGTAGTNNIFCNLTFLLCAININNTADNNKLFIISNSSPYLSTPSTIGKVTIKDDAATLYGITTNAITINDDSATSRIISGARGFALISSSAGIYSLVFLNFDTIVSISTSATFNVITTNGTLTGTNGADGNASIRMNNGTLYIENRLGVTRNFNILLLDALN